MKYADEITQKLKELIEKNYDIEKAYRFAGENAGNPELKKIFEDRAAERYEFRHQLRSEIRNFGETPARESSVGGDTHRPWMNLKTKLSGKKDEVILDEIIKEEKATLKEYDKVINNISTPPSTGNLLLKQKKEIIVILENPKPVEKENSRII